MDKKMGEPSPSVKSDSGSSTPEPKSRTCSFTQMAEYVHPHHTNAVGTVFGGQIMAWVDLCAAICAVRHSGFQCVTAGVDSLRFEKPVHVGEVANLVARLTATFRTSMEIEVVVHGEDPTTMRKWPCVTARLTFVAIDRDGQPHPVPPMLLDSDEAKRDQASAEARRQSRLSKRAPG